METNTLRTAGKERQLSKRQSTRTPTPASIPMQPADRLIEK